MTPQYAERKLIALVNDGRWTIDAEGRIWIARLHTGRAASAPKRSEKATPHGYLLVRAMLGGSRVVGLAHRLVWQALHGDIPDGQVINHKNGQKADNRTCNLEVVTYSENSKHAYRNGLMDEHGECNPAAKLTDHQVAEIRLAYASGGVTTFDLAARYGVRFQHISRLIRGDRRPREPGPRDNADHRHNSCEKDPVTGRFLSRLKSRKGGDPAEWPEDLRVREFPQ